MTELSNGNSNTASTTGNKSVNPPTTFLKYEEDIVYTENGGMMFNPYNEQNVEITLSDVQFILQKYGIPTPTVANIQLYKRAFVHKSYTKRPLADNLRENITIAEKPENCMPLKTKSNERLEFLGDGVLECIAKYILYRRFPKENEGFMTEKKIAIVKNESIGKIAYEMGLHKWLVISKHAEEKHTRTNLKKLGCLFEAFIGALFLDFNKIEVKDEDEWFKNIFITGPGFQMAQLFIENVFNTHIDWVNLIKNDDNYKNILQVKIQKEFKTTPDYFQISHTAETGYTMGVYLCLGQQFYEADYHNAYKYSDLKSFASIHSIVQNESKIAVFFAQGTHKIKKKAEQIACELAINELLRYN
jgi:dsRNA-specific ribonuclease